MKLIPLVNGLATQVDDADYEWLSQYRWRRIKGKSKGFYVWGMVNGSYVGMHRLIMGLENGDPRQVDHKEPSETLNNQRYNLRICTRAQNQHNRGPNKNNKSGHKGVSWSESHKAWQVSIIAHGTNKWLGRRKELSEAAALYCQAAQRLHGEFARVK